MKAKRAQKKNRGLRKRAFIQGVENRDTKEEVKEKKAHIIKRGEKKRGGKRKKQQSK